MTTSADGVRVKARIRLLPANEGGRTSPLIGPASYRPNHNFLHAENRDMGMGFIDIAAGTVVDPGEAVDLELTLYPWPPDVDLRPGREWRIQEGGRLVGTGTVLSVISDARDNS